MKKRILSLALAMVLLTGTALATNGWVKKDVRYNDIKIVLDGKEITPTDVNGKSTEPFIMEDSTYVPVRALAEALGYTVEWDDATKTVKISSGFTVEGDSVELVNDNVKITDASFNKYFGGDAAGAVAKLLAEGKCYVNGIQVPATADGIVEFQVNGVRSLYKTDIGWGYNVHKTTSADNLTFEAARLGFFETITTVRGHVTELTDRDVITWCTPNGFPIGFTMGNRSESKATLLQAIKNAEAAKTDVVVSENYGEDVPVGTKWVTQADMDAFTAAIKAAKDVAYNNAAELYEYDMAMYDLANAYGQGGNKPSGFIGAQGDGTK